MFFKNRGNELKTLVKNGDLANLQSIVENGDASMTTDSSGMTILHLAVKYDKLDLINYLLSSQRINIDAQDSSGTTPLVQAFREVRFEAAKLLIEADARIDIANAKGQTPLTYVVQYGLFTSSDRAMKKFRDKFIAVNERAPPSVLLTIFRSVSLESVLTLKSTSFLRVTLRSRISISSSESRTLVIAAMYSTYLDNLRILLNEGPNLTERRNIFRKELCRLIESDKNVYMNMIIFRRLLAPVLLLLLVRWNMVDQHLIAFFKKVLQKGDADALQIVLTPGVLEYVKQLTGEDLMAHLFANKNNKVVKVLQGREFDVSVRGESGLSPLHFAVRANSRANARLLLSKGADVNIKDDFGMTPLFDVVSGRLFSLLILKGADVQVVSDQGLATFEYKKRFIFHLHEYFLGHLVLMEACDLPISQEIRDKIQSNKKFQRRYEKYHTCVEQMKSYVVSGRVTMFIILTEQPKDVEKYLRNKRKACKDAIAGFPLWDKLRKKNYYYYLKLKKNAKLALETSKLKNMAIKIVAESICLFEADHLIVHRIVDFLTYADLCAIFR